MNIQEKLLQAKEEVKKELMEKKATPKVKPERRRIITNFVARKDYADMTKEEYEKNGYTNEK